MNYFTESTGCISYIIYGFTEPGSFGTIRTSGDQGPNEADHACLCVTGRTQPPAEPRGHLRVLSASGARVAGWEGGSD